MNCLKFSLISFLLIKLLDRGVFAKDVDIESDLDSDPKPVNVHAIKKLLDRI